MVSVRQVVAKTPVGHLTTLNPDGLQVMVVWIGIENDEPTFYYLAKTSKGQNVERDPLVALSFLSADIVKDKLPFRCAPG